MKNKIIIMLIGLFLLSFTSAIDNIGTFQTNTNFDLIQFCDSCTYVNLSGVQFPNGSLQNFNAEMTKTGYNYNYTYLTDTEGDYTYSVCGDKTGGFRCETFKFSISEGGVEITEGRSTLTIGLLILLTFFLFISLFAMFNIENYIAKFTLYWISHLLAILITFVSWQIGVEGLLGSMALTGIFKILFYTLTIAVVPMVFLSIAWVVYIHTFNEHFEKLIDDGATPEEAFRIAKKKSGGWFRGR